MTKDDLLGVVKGSWVSEVGADKRIRRLTHLTTKLERSVAIRSERIWAKEQKWMRQESNYRGVEVKGEVVDGQDDVRGRGR
jgi:hypothetical protein